MCGCCLTFLNVAQLCLTVFKFLAAHAAQELRNSGTKRHLAQMEIPKQRLDQSLWNFSRLTTTTTTTRINTITNTTTYTTTTTTINTTTTSKTTTTTTNTDSVTKFRNAWKSQLRKQTNTKTNTTPICCKCTLDPCDLIWYLLFQYQLFWYV